MMNIPEEEEIKQSKIIFMGDPYVGKTSIIRTFMEGKSQNVPYERTNKCGDFSK